MIERPDGQDGATGASRPREIQHEGADAAQVLRPQDEFLSKRLKAEKQEDPEEPHGNGMKALERRDYLTAIVLKSVRFSFLTPDEQPLRLIRRGELNCSVAGECQFILDLPQDVHPLEATTDGESQLHPGGDTSRYPTSDNEQPVHVSSRMNLP